MARPNTSFTLDVRDVAMIEEALQAKLHALSAKRLALSEQNPAHLMKIRAIDTEIHATRELLGRMHEQKVFFRPRGVYVSG